MFDQIESGGSVICTGLIQQVFPDGMAEHVAELGKRFGTRKGTVKVPRGGTR